MGWWYWSAPDGRWFCVSKDPTYECPVWKAVEDVLREGNEGGITERVLDFHRAAELIGMGDGFDLARLIRHQHRGGRNGRKRVDGKLTDRCKGCGAKLERLGFRCWTDRPYTEEEIAATPEMGATRALNAALGTEVRKTIRTWYAATKREAMDWAREELKLAKSIAAEVA